MKAKTIPALRMGAARKRMMSELTPEEYGAVYEALVKYDRTGEETHYSDNERVKRQAYNLVKASIDAAKKGEEARRQKKEEHRKFIQARVEAILSLYPHKTYEEYEALREAFTQRWQAAKEEIEVLKPKLREAKAAYRTEYDTWKGLIEVLNYDPNYLYLMQIKLFKEKEGTDFPLDAQEAPAPKPAIKALEIKASEPKAPQPEPQPVPESILTLTEPEIKAPEAQPPEAKAPEVIEPEIKAPEAKAPATKSRPQLEREYMRLLEIYPNRRFNMFRKSEFEQYLRLRDPAEDPEKVMIALRRDSKSISSTMPFLEWFRAYRHRKESEHIARSMQNKK
ncbi:MAG: hypothetical protein LBR73_07915 [Oscillospiraceae bacterium]|jgi:hypothetical protein|nr:hypothetical protein [Oscillospiraceae bacterium]